MEKIFYENSENNYSYTTPVDKAVIKNNLIHFNDVCNKIFADKIKYKKIFYTEKEIQELKNNPDKCKELNVEFI